MWFAIPESTFWTKNDLFPNGVSGFYYDFGASGMCGSIRLVFRVPTASVIRKVVVGKNQISKKRWKNRNHGKQGPNIKIPYKHLLSKSLPPIPLRGLLCIQLLVNKWHDIGALWSRNLQLQWRSAGKRPIWIHFLACHASCACVPLRDQ